MLKFKPPDLSTDVKLLHFTFRILHFTLFKIHHSTSMIYSPTFNYVLSEVEGSERNYNEYYAPSLNFYMFVSKSSSLLNQCL